MPLHTISILAAAAVLVSFMASQPVQAAEPGSSAGQCNTTTYCDCRVEGTSLEACQEASTCSTAETAPVEDLYKLAQCNDADPECTQERKFTICDMIIQCIEDPAYSPFG